MAGLSMGGYGALVYAMKHPDMFVACVAMSAAVRTDKQIMQFSPGRWKSIESVVYGPDLKGKARLTKILIANDPIHIIQTADRSALKKVKYYFDCGDNDHLTIGNSTMHILLTQRHIPHTFIMRPGRHSWEYWRSGLPNALKFIGQTFIH